MDRLPNAVWWEQIASFKNSIPKIYVQSINLTGKKFVLINEICTVPKEKRGEYILLFYSDDVDFEKYYFRLQTDKRLLSFLQEFYAVVGLDFSTFPDIDENYNREAIKRNRRFCVYLQKNDSLCVYNAVWSGKETYSLAFDNIEKGSFVAVSTYRLDVACMELFEDGYSELKKRIKPRKILCYGKIPSCMKKDVQLGLIFRIPTRFYMRKFNYDIEYPQPELFWLQKEIK